jgi:formate hydrogenlyase subunit 5
MDLLLRELKEQIEQQWPNRAKCRLDEESSLCEITCDPPSLPELSGRLFLEWNFSFAGLIVEEVIVEKDPGEWRLRYVFYGAHDAGLVHVLASAPLGEKTFPSIAKLVHAADWHEREAEDLYGLVFEGHPRLGDFILHNDRWCENLAPMRHYFDPSEPLANRRPDLNWRPQRIVEAPGAFAMPIGPKFSGVTESVHFLLETVGEDVIRTIPRLFYKYRAVEKMAEGRTVENTLLLAERFAATTAFAHALAFCQAVESICGPVVPPRARMLRMLLSELERLRHHAGAIQEICESTALVVANNQAALLEEELLRLSGAFTGHRYLFGLAVPGGLSRNFDDTACREAVKQVQSILKRLDRLEKMLRTSSSFLDRLEEVGIVSEMDARSYGLVGPVARASGVSRDVRKARPYSGYETLTFDVPSEQEGDGYARLRVLFAEARQSVKLMEQAAAGLPNGPVLAKELKIKPGAALGWVEAPRGATFHWVRIDGDGRVERYRLITPSFANWHGFHLAAEQFAFQDFPIILATFDLSVAENDR